MAGLPNASALGGNTIDTKLAAKAAAAVNAAHATSAALENSRSTRTSAEQTLANLKATREACESTVSRIDKQQESAQKTLEGIKGTLARWDMMKQTFDKAFREFAHTLADAMRDESLLPSMPDGPPHGATAHGAELAHSGLDDPQCVVECSEEARPAMGAGIAAHEYADGPEALRVKVKALAGMLRRAHHAAVYTGAGISTAAGIGDYASKAGGRSSVLPAKAIAGTPFDPLDAINASPTFTHNALVELHARGLIAGGWIQQNHDGLPQKAGLPQEAINEIHGSWFDPSNPVVPMSGSLRKDLVHRLRETTEECDLVIAMGTSLSGVSADQIVRRVATRSHKCRAQAEQPPQSGEPSKGNGGKDGDGVVVDPDGASVQPPSLGAVIINVQQTRLDGLASLRVFAKVDDVMKMLQTELGSVAADHPTPIKGTVGTPPLGDVWSGLHYDAESGERVAAGSSDVEGMILDLAQGARVQLAHGNAPMATVGTKGTVGPKTAQGHYTIECDDGVRRVLGVWMMEAARHGRLDRLPVVQLQVAAGSE